MMEETEQQLRHGLSLYESGLINEAEIFFTSFLEKNPRHGDGHNILGSIYAQQKKLNLALSLFQRAIEIEPNHPIYNSNYGNVLQDLGRAEESLPYYFKALQIYPDFVDANFNLGNALAKLQRYEEAFVYLNNTKRLDKNYIKSYVCCAKIYEKLRLMNQVLKELHDAEKINPASYEILSNLAVAYSLQKNFNQSVFYFKKAFETGQANAKFFLNYGTACVEMSNPAEAARAYLSGAKLEQDKFECLSRALHQKMMIADWSNIDEIGAEVVQQIQLGSGIVDPFGYMGFSDSEYYLHRAAVLYQNEKYPLNKSVIIPLKYPRHKKIKLAYVSGEFREHANGSLMAGLIECHDRDKFEVIGYDNGRTDESFLRSRLLKSFDEHIDIRPISDLELTAEIQKKEIDILFNLNGFFGEHRSAIFANRSAPIQINFLGCPGTMGVDYMDYLVADPVVIPQSSYEFYTEKIISLPHSYQINDSKRPELKKNLTRKDCGLPEKAFIFCCFNNIYKVTPPTFERWMRILKRVPGSVVWFYNNFPEAEVNLKRQAQLLGVDSGRLIFSPYIKMYDHLERYYVADLFLDSLPYNAHTSGSDALWANLPVLTLLGKSFAGRVGASLLHAIEMPELITYSEKEFEDKAVDLATHPEKLASLKIKLAKNRLMTPLFDTKLYTKHFESALFEAYERYQSDLSPAHILVKP